MICGLICESSGLNRGSDHITTWPTFFSLKGFYFLLYFRLDLMALLHWKRRTKCCCRTCCGVFVFLIISLAIYGRYLYKKDHCTDEESKQSIKDLVCHSFIFCSPPLLLSLNYTPSTF